jgi:hypothetical protein
MTLDPLDMSDLGLQDHRGPDDPTNYAVDSSLRAWQDTLPGRGSANRYFYRALFVDGAHNRSGLSLATPPVYLPKVEPPRAPVVTKVLGGDRQIIVQWAANREPDLAEYRVYRANDEADARDLRRMALVHTEAATAESPERLEWRDGPVPGRQTYFYRIVAVGSENLVSASSPPVAARAYDQTPPIPPAWASSGWRAAGGGIELNWQPPAEPLDVIVLRRDAGFWVSISSWLPLGTTSFVDGAARPGVINRYRLRGRNAAGNMSIVISELGIPPT